MADSVLTLRRLGRTDIYVTPIGLGGGWLGHTGGGYTDETAIATVHRALELGINLIDTSAAYGQSERRIGPALERWYEHGGKRKDIVISTKTGTRTSPPDYSGAGTRRSVEESLRLLKTDYIDVMLVHDPADLTPVLAPGGAWETLKELKEQGVIRAMGLGVRTHEFHRRLMETGDLDVSLTYLDYNLLNQSAAGGVLTPAAAHGAGVFNGMTLANGLLSGLNPLEAAQKRRMPEDSERVQQARALWEWADEKGISLLALNLQFCLRERRITSTLVGAARPSEIEADIKAVSEPIAEDVWQELEERFGLP